MIVLFKRSLFSGYFYFTFQNLRKFNVLCKAGGSKPFIELVALAGLNNPFQETTVKPVITEVKAWLDSIDDTKY